ncbi:MAG: MFS transporter, partial [Acidimicrobiales bacterium]
MRPLEKFTMGIGPLLVCGFGVPVSNSMIFPALSDLQDEYGFSDAGLGYIAASGFLASLIVQLTVAPLADRRNPKVMVLAGVVFAVVGSVLFAFGGSLPVFVVARAIAGSSLGMSGPAVRALAANIDRSRAAERMARLRGVEIAGFTGGPLIGALLIGPFGIRGAFLVFAGIGRSRSSSKDSLPDSAVVGRVGSSRESTARKTSAPMPANTRNAPRMPNGPMRSAPINGPP